MAVRLATRDGSDAGLWSPAAGTELIRLQKRLQKRLVSPTFDNEKAPVREACEERMMGLEPTTFCMASNRDVSSKVPITPG